MPSIYLYTWYNYITLWLSNYLTYSYKSINNPRPPAAVADSNGSFSAGLAALGVDGAGQGRAWKTSPGRRRGTKVEWMEEIKKTPEHMRIVFKNPQPQYSIFQDDHRNVYIYIYVHVCIYCPSLEIVYIYTRLTWTAPPTGCVCPNFPDFHLFRSSCCLTYPLVVSK